MVIERIKRTRKRACDLIDRALKEEKGAKEDYDRIEHLVRRVSKRHAKRLREIGDSETGHAKRLREIHRRLC